MVDQDDVDELAELTNELAKRMNEMADALAELSTHVRILTVDQLEDAEEG